VALTSATSPSLEDLLGAAIPGAPSLVLHNAVYAPEVGDAFMQAFSDAEDGLLGPFILVLEGSLGNEAISGDGHWSGMGVDPVSGQPVTTNEWIDRLAPRAGAVVAMGTCATYGGIPAMRNNPTGAMGLPDYLGWDWKTSDELPIVCVPGCPAQPDNMAEVLLYLVLYLAGQAPKPSLDSQLRPTWLFENTTREGCNRAGFTEQGSFATEYGSVRAQARRAPAAPPRRPRSAHRPVQSSPLRGRARTPPRSRDRRGGPRHRPRPFQARQRHAWAFRRR
jgi:hydrogenase small subunit